VSSRTDKQKYKYTTPYRKSQAGSRIYQASRRLVLVYIRRVVEHLELTSEISSLFQDQCFRADILSPCPSKCRSEMIVSSQVHTERFTRDASLRAFDAFLVSLLGNGGCLFRFLKCVACVGILCTFESPTPVHSCGFLTMVSIHQFLKCLFESFKLLFCTITS
jgi:hypothetical protein